jgi:hypothetical protein
MRSGIRSLAGVGLSAAVSLRWASAPLAFLRFSAPLYCLLFQSPRSIRSLAFLWLNTGDDWQLVEVVLFLCSEVLLCFLLYLCVCVVLCLSDYCPQWPSAWAHCCAVFVFSGWCCEHLPRPQQRL